MKKRMAWSIIGLLFCTTLSAQDIDMTLLEKLHIRNIGPAGMSGRVTAIDVDLSDPDRIYIGTASGGVWLSENGGTNWRPIFDEQPTQSIGAIAINQSNPSDIWVGTGEGNPRNSHNSGAGVFRSLDRGKTWQYMGLRETKLIHRLIIHRDDPNVVFVGAMGSAWGSSSDRGVYKTVDGGKTWQRILYINDRTGVGDMIVDPTNPNKILVAMWEFGRSPWYFESGGDGSGLHITYDGGSTWRQLDAEEGLPEGTLGRMGLAIAPSDPDRIYALIEAEKNALYQSTNGGVDWTLVSDKNIGNRPFYYADIYVDPKNENRIYNLWSYVSRSEDGGKTFETIMDYGNNIHPDHHAFWIHPDDPDYLIDGNDGGLTISRDGGSQWTFVSNLPVGQFYHINIDNDFPYHVYGGMQDNGSWIGPSSVLKSGGIRNYDWQELYFGDGFDVSARPSDSRYGYAMSQGGNLAYYDRVTGRTRFIKPTHPEGKPLRFNWNAALAQSANHDCGIYYGSQYVHRSMDCGQSWTIISPDLTTNDTTKQQQQTSGGLTIDDTNAENHTTILCIAPSPHDENVIWVGTDDGNLQRTTDGGANWTNVSNRLPALPKNAWIPQIEVSQADADEVFVVVNNYRMNDWAPYLYHTSNGGRSWTRLVDSDDVDGFVAAIVQDPVEPNLVFLGTDVGLYVSFDRGRHWQKWSQKAFPSVQIRDLKIQTAESDLVIGTFGRAIWILDDLHPLRAIAASGGDALNRDMRMFDAAPAYLTAYRSYDGIRFIAQNEFVGENQARGATLTIWKRPSDSEDDAVEMPENDKEEETSEPSTDRMQFFVLAEGGDTLRRFRRKLKDGMNRFQWPLNRDGVRYPSRAKKKADQDPPGGLFVMPGDYRVVGLLGDHKDSITVRVMADPRSDLSSDDLRVIESAILDHYDVVRRAAEGFDQLKEAKKTIERVDRMLENAPDSTRKTLRKLGKKQRERIDSLMGLFMLPEGTKGIQRNPNTVNSTLFRANAYLGTTLSVPGENALQAEARAREKTGEVLELINAFFDAEWKAYRSTVEAVEVPLFKDRATLQIE